MEGRRGKPVRRETLLAQHKDFSVYSFQKRPKGAAATIVFTKEQKKIFERKLTHLYLPDKYSSDHAGPIAAGPEVAGNQAAATEGI